MPVRWAGSAIPVAKATGIRDRKAPLTRPHRRLQLVRTACESRVVPALTCVRDLVVQQGLSALWGGFGGNLLRSWLTAVVLLGFDVLRTAPSKRVLQMCRRLITNCVVLGAVLLLN